MIKKLISITISIFCLFQGQAETKVMTLHDCMVYAISNSTKIRIQNAEINDCRLEKRDAILSAFTPMISADTYAYYNFGRSIDPQTNTYFTQTSFHNNYSVSAGLTIFDGFQAVNNIIISKTGLLISKSREKQAEADICLAVMEAYYNVVYSKRLIDVYLMQVEDAEKALSVAERREELGQVGHADVIQLEADLTDRQYDLINAENRWADQLLILTSLMFWPVDEELKIDTELPMWNEETFSENEVVDYALKNNSAIQEATWTRENAKRELHVAKWQLLPSIKFYAGWSTTYYTYTGANTPSFGNQFRNNGGEYIEFAVTVPIYNHLKGFSNIGKKRNSLLKATAELEQKQRDVEVEVRRAMQDRDGASAAYRQALKKSWVQEEAYILNKKKLEQGLISPLEFQMANNNYLKAKADEMNSLFNFQIKQAIVKYYNGVDYINQ